MKREVLASLERNCGSLPASTRRVKTTGAAWKSFVMMAPACATRHNEQSCFAESG
jgi:hypothetical protein